MQTNGALRFAARTLHSKEKLMIRSIIFTIVFSLLFTPAANADLVLANISASASNAGVGIVQTPTEITFTEPDFSQTFNLTVDPTTFVFSDASSAWQFFGQNVITLTGLNAQGDNWSSFSYSNSSGENHLAAFTLVDSDTLTVDTTVFGSGGINTVTLIPSAVPEPSAFLFFSLASIVTFGIRRRR